jgi:hypothetical protein
MHGASAASLLEHWREFYLMVGTAAGALLALLFVAASVNPERMTTDPAGATRTYMSPVGFHFSSVLFMSAVGLVPTHSKISLGLLVGLNGLCGAAYAAFVLRRVLTDGIADGPDRFFYGAAPLIAYLAGLAAAVFVFRGFTYSAELIAGSVVLLLIVNIRNAWDLLISLARRRAQGGPPPST